MDVVKKQKGHGDTSLDTAVSLKKGTLPPPRKSIFSKGKRRLEMQYFKTAVLRRKAEQKRSCCVRQRSYYQKNRADKPLTSRLRVIGSASMRLAL